MTSYRTSLFFAQGVGRRAARGRHEAVTVLPATGSAVAQSSLPASRRSVITSCPPSAASDDGLLDVEVPEVEPGETDTFELVDSDAAFAHVLHAGRAVVADPAAAANEGDSDWVGLPGILSPEQIAQVLAQRDAHRRA